MNRMLLLSQQKNAADLSNAIKKATTCSIDVVNSISEAKHALTLAKYDYILISTPLLDEQHLLFARHCAEITQAGILLLLKEDLSHEMKKSIADACILVMKQNIHSTSFCKIMRMLESKIHQSNGICDAYEELQTKIDEVRLIDRAKSVLMERLLFSEEQAYRYITKHAMDMRVTKKKVAQAVLYTYGGTDPLKKES